MRPPPPPQDHQYPGSVYPQTYQPSAPSSAFNQFSGSAPSTFVTSAPSTFGTSGFNPSGFYSSQPSTSGMVATTTSAATAPSRPASLIGSPGGLAEISGLSSMLADGNNSSRTTVADVTLNTPEISDEQRQQLEAERATEQTRRAGSQEETVESSSDGGDDDDDKQPDVIVQW